MIDNARAYLGQSWIGTNQYDKGQCVGLFNKVVQNVTGVLYPIQGAQTAFQVLSATNKAPNLCQQVINNPSDLKQLPSVGDWIIWNTKVGGGAGHIACVESVSASGFTSIDQNWVANTVTRENHNWSNVAGWIHFFANEPKPTPAPDPTAALTARIKELETQLGTATTQLNQAQAKINELSGANQALQASIKELEAMNASLSAQLAAAGQDTANLNKLGEALVWLLQRLGLTK